MSEVRIGVSHESEVRIGVSHGSEVHILMSCVTQIWSMARNVDVSEVRI